MAKLCKNSHTLSKGQKIPHWKQNFWSYMGNLSQLQRYLISKNQNKIGVYFGSCSGGLCSCVAAIVIGMSISAGAVILEPLKLSVCHYWCWIMVYVWCNTNNNQTLVELNELF